MVKLLLFGHAAHSERVKGIVNYALTRKNKNKKDFLDTNSSNYHFVSHLHF